MEKKKLLPRLILKLVLGFNSTLLIALIVVGMVVFGSGVDKSIDFSLLSIQPANAQRITPSEVWQQVYQQLPDLPRENKYINKENGKVADNNTLISRLIRYHVYVKGRSPIYRLDWKLTLADYLGANEIMYDGAYPSSDTLRVNPIEGDKAAIARLTRSQRNTLVQVLVNIFNPNQNTPAPSPSTSTIPSSPTIPKQPQRGGAELLR